MAGYYDQIFQALMAQQLQPRQVEVDEMKMNDQAMMDQMMQVFGVGSNDLSNNFSNMSQDMANNRDKKGSSTQGY